MQATPNTSHLETSTHATTEHTGPHIPKSKGESIPGWDIAGFSITNTVFSTWLFMGLLFVVIALFYRAITSHSFPRVRTLGLDIVERIFAYATGLLGTAQMARRYMWLLGGIMVVILSGNIFGLILDWSILVSRGEWLGMYLRPIYSDLSTTLVLSLSVIIVAQITAFAMKGPLHHLGHYFWNYHGDTLPERIVSVFVGWLHFAGEFIRIGSLSMRLFLNIFVGAILIAVIVFVGEQIPSFHTGVFRILAVPFWFFELLVAFLQAYIFMTLSALYIRESIPEHTSH